MKDKVYNQNNWLPPNEKKSMTPVISNEKLRP